MSVEKKAVPSAAYREQVRREVLADPDLELEIREFKAFIEANPPTWCEEEGTKSYWARRGSNTPRLGG